MNNFKLVQLEGDLLSCNKLDAHQIELCNITNQQKEESHMSHMNWKSYLDFAQMYANKASGCNKVAVGSVIVQDNHIVSMGANRAVPDLCKTQRGCLRVEKYGNDSKNHRNPEDCRAIHSEIDAICGAASIGVPIGGASIFVTRYPCEGCAKAIIAAGIKTVYYGGTTRISQQTADMFDKHNIDCIYIADWKEDMSDR